MRTSQSRDWIHVPRTDMWILNHWTSRESESHSVVSDSLWPHGLYSPWNSPGQNTGVGSLSLLQGIFPIQELNPGLLHCRQILYQLSQQGSPQNILCIYLFIWLCWILAAVCRMLSCGMGTLSCPMCNLIPQLGMEPGSPVLGAQNPSHWTIREVLPKQKFCPH